MKKIILAILLLPLYAYSQTFDIVTSISRDGCDLNFFNATGVRIASLNLNEVNFWNKSDGSYFIKDNKLQVNVTKQLTNPSFAGLANYLILVKDSCIITGGSTVSIPQPLYVIDTTTDSICFVGKMDVIDSSNVNIVKRCYYATPAATAIGINANDNLEQILMFKTSGGVPSFYYEVWNNLTNGATVYERLENGTATGSFPTQGIYVLPCERESNLLREMVYDKVQTGYYVSVNSEDYPDNYRLDLDLSSLPLDYAVVDWGDGMTEQVFNNATINHIYTSSGQYNVVVSFGDPIVRQIIGFSTKFVEANTSNLFTAYAYDYYPMYEYIDNINQSVSFTLISTSYNNNNIINPSGTIITKEQYLKEVAYNQYLANPYAQKVKKIIGHSTFAAGGKDDLRGIVEDYLSNVEGISASLAYAKKITITNISKDAGVIMHVGNASVTDKHTPYELKEGYTFYQEGRLYELREIIVLNDPASPKDLDFSFEIEY